MSSLAREHMELCHCDGTECEDGCDKGPVCRPVIFADGEIFMYPVDKIADAFNRDRPGMPVALIGRPGEYPEDYKEEAESYAKEWFRCPESFFEP